MSIGLVIGGSFVALVLVSVAMYLFAAIVPYVPPFQVGLGHIVFGNREILVVLGWRKTELDRALSERDAARKNLHNLAEGNPSVVYVSELSEKFKSSEVALKKARQRFDRAIGVAFILGRGHDAMHFLK